MLARPDIEKAVSGVMLLELLIAMIVVVVAILGFSQSVLSGVPLTDSSSEMSRAITAANQVISEMRDAPFDEVFARYNDDLGPAIPGSSFDVEGLSFRGLAGPVLAGRISFPVVAGQLNEAVVDSGLGMPMDLNGDGVIDGAAVIADYDVLPVEVEVRWTSSSVHRVVVRTILTSDS